MSDVLSQNEIDNLLKALSSGEVDVNEMKKTNEVQVKEYDFARISRWLSAGRSCYSRRWELSNSRSFSA